jgi:thymidylate kinase
MNSTEPVLGVVGPCAAGKSTLVSQLRSLGYHVKHIAQEHSYVEDMWVQIAKPDFLIYLDVSYTISCERNRSSWSRKIYNNQVQRLSHARKNADLYIHTDDKSPGDVLDIVVNAIDKI